VSVALVTGGASGIGRAVVERLEGDGFEVVVVDVAEDPSLDVAEPLTWGRVAARLERLDVACLNAGVVTGHPSIVDLPDEAYRRIVRVNVDGVVFGVRALTPLLERSGGGDIVVTASLAGLTTMASDPIYAGTKHFLVGFVRSVADQRSLSGDRRYAAARRGGPGAAPGIRVPAALAGGRRGNGRGSPRERRDRPGMGLPAGPQARAVPVPWRPGAAQQGRGGRSAAALSDVEPTPRARRP